MPKPKIKIDLQRAQVLAERGLTHEQISDALGISRTTLQARKRENAQLVQALARGRARAVAHVADKFWEVITARTVNEDGEEVYRFREDTRLDAMKFFLERRGGWMRESKLVTSSEDVTGMDVTIKIVGAQKEDADEAQA